MVRVVEVLTPPDPSRYPPRISVSTHDVAIKYAKAKYTDFPEWEVLAKGSDSYVFHIVYRRPHFFGKEPNVILSQFHNGLPLCYHIREWMAGVPKITIALPRIERQMEK
jgi:hypothetical protein